MATLWRRSWGSANPSIQTLAPLAHWLGRVESEFKTPRQAYVFEWEGAVAAFVVLEPSKFYLHQLFVAPKWQRRGWGASLIGWIHATFPDGWSLHVAASNTSARRFYERHGLRAESMDVHPLNGRERVLYRAGAPCSVDAVSV